MPIEDDPEIERSPLSREVSQDGIDVKVEIYRLEGSGEGWSLEVIDHELASTVWEELFATDHDALLAFQTAVQQEGIRTFLQSPPSRLH